MMISLSAKIRKTLGKKTKFLLKVGILPAVLYGPKIKNLNLEINSREFEKVFKKVGESSLIKLNVKDQKSKLKEFLVLIHDVQFDPLTEKPIHVDFYQPPLKEKIEAKVPLVFEGEAPAVKELGGTLIKHFSEIEVKALPKNLPHEIKIDISQIKTFEDNILISDLRLPKGVEVLRDPKEILVSVSPSEKVEEELAKPIEEKIEEVERLEKKKEEKSNLV